ncbi:UNVERIFIED_ORG: hypothetical protein GGE36_004593 [Rhizobium etli]
MALSAECEVGLLSDIAIDIDDLDLLEAIIADACNELRVSPDHGLVTRVVDLHSQGQSQSKIMEALLAEFGNSPARYKVTTCRHEEQ